MFGELEISLLSGEVYVINNNGRRTEPWGTPHVRKLGWEIEVLILTLWVGLEIYEWNHFSASSLKLNCDDKHSYNCLWSIVSKAAESSSRTRAVGLPSAKFRWISLNYNW